MIKKSGFVVDNQVIFFSTYELMISVVFGLRTVFIVRRFIRATLFKPEKPNEFMNNVSTNIVSGGLTVCVLILVQSSVLPSVDAPRTMVLGQEQLTFKIVAISFGYFLAFYALSIIISICVIYASMRIHMAATVDVDEIAEIRGDNIAQAILLTAIFVGVTLFLQEPVGRFIETLVDYDDLERIEAPVIQVPDVPEDMIIVPTRKASPD